MGKFWLAYDPDNAIVDDAIHVKADDAAEAARVYAKRADWRSADYTYAREGGVVMVRLDRDGEPWQRFIVSGESVLVYHATADKGGDRAP